MRRFVLLTVALLLGGLLAGCAYRRLPPPLVDAAGEEIAEAHPEDHTDVGGCVGVNTAVTAPVRAGRVAFRHEVRRCAERAELRMRRTEIGETYWTGWSLFIPETYEATSEANIFAQWAAYPKKKSTELPCWGIGHKLEIRNGWLEYHVQGSDAETGRGGGYCERIKLAPMDASLKGRWIDFVHHARWTGDSGGFVRLWMRVGDAPFEKVVDARGRTWWNDEGTGPYFKMGMYTGDPGWAGHAPAVVYTDEYRLGNADATCRDVAPDPTACTSLDTGD